MRVFTSTDFEGFWPVGTAAVVLADTPDEAMWLLEQEIKQRGLHVGKYSVTELTQKQAVILCDGDY